MEIAISVIALLAVAALVWPVVPATLSETGAAFREGIRDYWPHAFMVGLILLLLAL